MDPANPVVKLCVEGMEHEAHGHSNEAAALFQRAWEQSCDDFERCIAAHYVARHQESAIEALHWNRLALDHANALIDDRAAEFFPSLYLNMGKSHEDLGNPGEAARFYKLAQSQTSTLPEGGYREIVNDGIRRGLARVNSEGR